MHGAGTITQRLNQAGYTMPSGKLFKKTGVEEMLKNPVYGGFVSLKGERFAGKHEPLIDLATWERVEEINSERSRRRVKTSTQRHPLLAGLGVCTLCGAPLWHQTYTETGRRYYYCSTKVHHGEGPHPGLVCTGHKMSAEKIEHALLGWIGGLALTPGLLEDARQILATTPVSPKVDMVKVRERLKRLGQAYADDAFSEAEYTERKQVLLDQLAAPLSSLPPVDNTAVLGLLNDLPALFRDATPDERRALIGELVSEIYVGHSEIYALRPTKAAEALFLAAEQRPDWRAIDTEVLTSGNLVGRVGFHGAPRTRTAH